MAIKLTISGHPYIITEADGYAEIYPDGQSRSKRHHSINAVIDTTVRHQAGAITGSATLELTVESVPE